MPANTSFFTVPNQKTVCVHRDMPKKGESNFLILKKENLYRAYKDLGYSGIYLYLYFVANKDKYTFALSPQAIVAETGISMTTCRSRINTMIELGYLVQHSENSNRYDFYEYPYGKKDNVEDENS